MKILGEIKPTTNKDYLYSLITDTGKPVTVLDWKVEYNGGILQTNAYGRFKFGTTLSGKTVKLIARTKAGEIIKSHSVTLNILAGVPKIMSLKWQDQYGRDIQKETSIGYLDKIQLLIKTQNIPIGDTLSITVFEDEYEDGHGDSSRNMGTYTTSAVNKNGNAYLYFNNIKIYQKTLNDLDYINEDIHEFYVRVVYRSHIKRIEDGIQIKIKNEPKQYIKPPVTNQPVVVKKPDASLKKEDKKKVNVTFNMFFDGTMNNMINTKARKESNSPDVKGVFDKKSNKKDDSYMNFYSNVALLFMNNIVKKEENIISIYTEGIGTYDKKSDQVFPGGAMGESILIYLRGVKDKVMRGIAQMKEKAKAKYFDKKIEIGRVTINVFGFSRGAAAARYFMSQEVFIQIGLNLKSLKDISFNFIGLYDTVASFGVMHINDVYELNLDIGGKAKKVIQLAAADEYRSNFKLTDITSCIKAGVGYELIMPGVHSDIGGGYGECDPEERYLGEETTYDKNASTPNLEKIKKRYEKEGWYRYNQFKIRTETKSNFSRLGTHTFSYLHKLYGVREDLSSNGKKRGITNVYQYIPLAIMKTFCEKYANMPFDNDKIKKNYSVKGELEPVKNQLYNYAISNDGINSLRVTLPHNQLIWVRNKYLHRSNKDDDLTMSGRYDKNGNPDRDVLEG